MKVILPNVQVVLMDISLLLATKLVSKDALIFVKPAKVQVSVLFASQDIQQTVKENVYHA